MNMIITVLIGLSLFMWVPMMAQTGTTKQNAPEVIGKGDSVLLSKLHNTRIVLKDGTIKKNCSVKEINAYWIVYEKEGSLHDLMIDEIERIELAKMQAVFFNDNHKPSLGSYVY